MNRLTFSYLRRTLFRLLLLPAMCWVSPAQAYFCWAPRDIREEAHDADVVFVGSVMAIKDIGASTEELGTARKNILFRVERAWKGLEQDQRDVHADAEALYEYDFKIGQAYLVLGFRMYDDRISMIGCPRVELADAVQASVDKLGDPQYDYAGVLPPAEAAGADIELETLPADSAENQDDAAVPADAGKEAPADADSKAGADRKGDAKEENSGQTLGDVHRGEKPDVEALEWGEVLKTTDGQETGKPAEQAPAKDVGESKAPVKSEKKKSPAAKKPAAPAPQEAAPSSSTGQ